MFAAQRLLVVIASLGLVVGSSVACGGDDDDSDDGSEPAATSTADATQAPDETPEDDDSDDGDGDNGNGDDGEAPVFEDGAWTGGEIEVAVTTGKERVLTAALLDTSGTDGSTTRLIYGRELDTINLSISREYEPFAVSVTVQEDGVPFRVVSAFESPCEVTYTETSETRIEGTFRCGEAEVELSLDPSEVSATLEGSFTATR